MIRAKKKLSSIFYINLILIPYMKVILMNEGEEDEGVKITCSTLVDIYISLFLPFPP